MTRACTTSVEDRWAWADHGRCRGHAALFYNEDHDANGARRKKELLAKQLCEQCPVLADCRRHAMHAPELYGVWGGLSEMERHTLAGRQRTG